MGFLKREGKCTCKHRRDSSDFIPRIAYLLLLKTLYGTKQAAKAFWLKLLEALHGMDYTRSAKWIHVSTISNGMTID
jgi:hypothetical protein